MKSAGATADWDKPVYFPEWRAILDLEPLEPYVRARHASAVIRYLHHLKTTHEPASIAGAKRYLDAAGASGSARPGDREALRWFFLAFRRVRANAPGETAHLVPVRTANPMPIPEGTPEWEANLIRQIRLRGFLWNTGQIYRAWLRRFAAAIAPVTPDQAGPGEVHDFLSDLAVRQQVSASTQRQALNALVFYYAAVLKHDLGDLGDYRRPRRGPKVPVVLSRLEIERLFSHLKDDWLLMAQLQYGSGLRVTELLELRVQSLDLDRRRILIFGGKGDKDRVEGLRPHAV